MKNGWFVSASPLIFGASKIETKRTLSVEGGEVTVGDLTADLPRLSFTDGYENIAKNLCAGNWAQGFLDNIEIFYLAEDTSDATDLTLSNIGKFEYVRFRLNGADIPFTGDKNNITILDINESPIADSACKDAFDSLLLDATSSSETSTGKALAGNGFQVGYRNGDYRYSLTNYSWAADSDKLDFQLAMIEYYLAKGFLLGLGAANVKLDSSIGSQSQGAIAFSIGYQYPLFKNFFVEANYTLISADFSLQKEEIIADGASINQTDTRVIGLVTKEPIPGGTKITPILSYDGIKEENYRVTVTRSQSRTGYQITTTKTVEVKNPSALTIKFTYKF